MNLENCSKDHGLQISVNNCRYCKLSEKTEIDVGRTYILENRLNSHNVNRGEDR